MPYDPTIPAPTDLLSDSQSDIQQNFNLANEFFGFDHVDYVAASDNGKHNQSTYPEQGADANTLADENALYTKDVGGNTRLFLRQENNGTIIQLTGRDPSAVQNGLTFLPGGILMQWGRTGVSVGNGSVVAFNTAFSANAFSVTLSPISAGSGTWGISGTPSGINFTVSVQAAGPTAQIFWMATGPA